MPVGYFVTGSSAASIELEPLATSGSATGGSSVTIAIASGIATKLVDPNGCIVVGDNLWVADAIGVSGNGSIFAWPTTTLGTTGDPAPTVTIDGASTGFNFCVDVGLDSTGRIYVANEFNNSIDIFAAGANGDVAPTAQIIGGSTTLSSPQGVALDSNDNVYVVQFGEAKILMWNAGNFGNHAPDKTITGAATSLDSDGPNTVRIDATDNIWVGQPDGSILKFAAGANGNVAPLQTIAGTPCQYTVTSDPTLQQGGSGMSAVITMPTLTIGQAVIVQFEFDSNMHNFTAPSGWTNFTPTMVGSFFYGGAGAFRVADGTETPTYTWTWDTFNNNWTARIILVSTTIPITHFNIHDKNANSNNGGTTLTALGSSGSGPSGNIGDLRLVLFGTAGVETITVNSGLTSIYSVSGAHSSIAAGFEVIEATPVNRTATSSGSDNWGALNLIINPSGGINPTGISFDPTGNIYVTDNNNDQGLEYDAASTNNAVPLNTITDLAAGAWGNAQGAGAPPPPNPPPYYYPSCALPSGTAGIPYEVQTPAKLLDEGRLALCSRFFIDINTNNEQLLLTICVDNVDYVYPLLISTAMRSTVEVAYQVSGRVYSIRLVACLSFGQVELFEVWTDLDEGKEPEQGGSGS